MPRRAMTPEEAIATRQTIDTLLAELVAAARSGADAATVRQLARVRLEVLDDEDLAELMLLAAGMFAELGRRNEGR